MFRRTRRSNEKLGPKGLIADSEAIWTPSKLIDRLGKEINDESSVLYWAHKTKSQFSVQL